LIRFVLDASVTLAWLIDPTTPAYAIHVRELLLQGNRALVPVLWQSEVANGFLVAERRNILTQSDTAQILHRFDTVLAQSIDIKTEPVSIRRIAGIGRQFSLTAYDAMYLDLALEEQLPIATLDRGLAQAIRKAGARLVP